MSTNSNPPASIVSPELHRAILTKVRVTTLRQLMEQLKTQFAPQLLSVGVVVGLSWHSASRLHLAIWAGTQLLAVYGLEAYLYFYARRREIADQHLRRHERLFRLLVFLNSAYFAPTQFGTSFDINNNNFGKVTGVSVGARVVQFAGRLSF